MKGLPGVLTYREVPEQQTSHLVRICFQDAAAALYSFGQIRFIKPSSIICRTAWSLIRYFLAFTSALIFSSKARSGSM